MANANVLTFTDANWDADVLKSNHAVLVDFWAEWCGPCRALTPVIDELATTTVGKARVGKFNIDENPNVPVKYGIQAIPTLMVFKGGQMVEKIVGLRPKAEILSALQKHMA